MTEYTIQTTLSSFHSSNIRSSVLYVFIYIYALYIFIHLFTFSFYKRRYAYRNNLIDRYAYAYAHANRKGTDQRSILNTVNTSIRGLVCGGYKVYPQCTRRESYYTEKQELKKRGTSKLYVLNGMRRVGKSVLYFVSYGYKKKSNLPLTIFKNCIIPCECVYKSHRTSTYAKYYSIPSSIML